ncbi:dipeptidase [Jeotgalibacillus haloalkalitolerans]|uniref:Dipeptidase n=1 Tax=Jeotgalibacillus haloalkalitolerans TaxID=3104292 RepID=A0ABU5KJ09_9BACL|nr:dipeptidase [Jeotgalibacillus sp. HH7-29]MDZ5711103.1 dipeptidase [Jeotgalibacillus sp. HH7-29]
MALDQYFRDNRDRHLAELTEWLSIPSVSSLSEHKQNTLKGGEWIAENLRKIGMENVQIIQTPGHPVVYGDWLHAEDAPTVLVYGHYDVQPVDPLHLWETEPFQPAIRDNKIYARGATDDKGQSFMHVKAAEALLKEHGKLPVNLKFLIEGEEEIGSVNLPKFVEENQDLLASDVIVISDTGMQEKGQPAICYGLRGLAGIQIDVKGAKGDLHSGLYGGAVQNALHALVSLLDSFRDENGVIQVDRFYDKVEPLTDEEKAAYEALNFSDEALKKELEVEELFGEKGYTSLERMWTRPTLEINGMWGGFEGEGIKTVLPNEAHAKITCRLVPHQDPDEIVELLTKHVEAHTPAGVTVEVTPFDKGAPYVTPYDHPAIQAAGASYEKVYGVPTQFIRGGGSIPIVAAFDQILQKPIVLMGFGLPGENFHAPNEHFHLENFDQGLRVIADYYSTLPEVLKK